MSRGVVITSTSQDLVSRTGDVAMLSIFEHHVEGGAVSGLEQAKGGEVVAFVEGWSVGGVVRRPGWPGSGRGESAETQEEGGSWEMHGEDRKGQGKKGVVVEVVREKK